MNSKNLSQKQRFEKYLEELYKGSSALTQIRSKDLRHRMTPAEERLWQFLRNRQLKGRKFRRQHPLANYILDFYCHECRLAVELDGNMHKAVESKEYDDLRTADLNANGISVLRFWNGEVMNDIEAVLKRISDYLN